MRSKAATASRRKTVWSTGKEALLVFEIQVDRLLRRRSRSLISTRLLPDPPLERLVKLEGAFRPASIAAGDWALDGSSCGGEHLLYARLLAAMDAVVVDDGFGHRHHGDRIPQVDRRRRHFDLVIARIAFRPIEPSLDVRYRLAAMLSVLCAVSCRQRGEEWERTQIVPRCSL